MKKFLLFSILFVLPVIAFEYSGFKGFGWSELKTSNTPPEQISMKALKDLIRETGVMWRGRWNENSGLPHRLFSDGFPFAVSDSADAIAKCLSFVDNHAELFGGISSAELYPMAIDYKLETWYLVFGQRHKGLPVDGARADFRIKRNILTCFGADLNLQFQSHIPNIDASYASQIMKAEFPFDSYTAELVYFAPSGGKLCWRMVAECANPRHRWVCHIDAHTGEIVAVYDDIRTDVSGIVSGNVLPNYMTDIPVEYPFPYLMVGVDDFDGDISDSLGHFSVPIPPASGWNLSARLEGLYARVIPVIGTSLRLLVPADEEIVNLRFEPTATYLDETGAYYHINKVHKWLKTLDPDYAFLDRPINVFVKDTVSPCPDNAFWDGTSVHMGRGSRCNNFGFFSDIFYHEYGHGITHYIYPGILLPYVGESGAIDEAISDYTACTITDEPLVGEGVCSPGAFRNMNNRLVFPDDWVDEVHADGRIIGGAFWDMRSAIGTGLADTLVHYAKYGRPTNFEDYLTEILVVDDDDGNIFNGTPHFHEIYGAFRAHGIGRFDVAIIHTPHPDTEDPIGPYEFSCLMMSTLVPDPTSVVLYYSVNEGLLWNEIPMSPTGTEREFSCEMPGVPMGTIVWYYIFGCDTLGLCATAPDSAPERYFSFTVGTDTIPPKIKHKPLTESAVEAKPYRVKFTASDNLGIAIASVIWRINEEPEETLIATRLHENNFIAFIDPISVSVGDSISYKIMAVDGAGTPNIKIEPEAGWFTFKIVRAYWFDFESVAGFTTPTGGWQWGIPSMSIGAYSGSKVWGTILVGDYASNANYELITPSFDVSDWDAVAMEMWAYFSTDRPFDGGNVWVSSDGGIRWYILRPLGGYPVSFVYALSEPGFAGLSNGWKKFEFDLTPFIMGGFGTLRFKFVFKSDDATNAPGWYIDDFGLLERQIILPPSHPRAFSGFDRGVPLIWSPPDPENVTGVRTRPMRFDGYNIYRADSPGEYPDYPINPLPIEDTTYVDLALINEREYFYRITAVYGDKESEPTTEVSATPFNARASIFPDSIYIDIVQSGTPFDTNMVISNIGDGVLSFTITELTCSPYRIAHSISRCASPLINIFDVLRSMHEDGVIVSPTFSTMVPPNPSNWRHVLRDPDEFLITKDIKDVYAQHDATNFWLKFDSWQNMGNPATDFFAGFGLDIDLDPSTGSPDFMGVEYLLAIGALPIPGVPAVVLRYNPSSAYGWDLAGMPHWTFATGDSIGIGITKAMIENPPSVHVVATVLVEMSGVPIPVDMAPDIGREPVLYILSDAWWITEDPIIGEVRHSSPQNIILTVDVPALLPGLYYTWLSIATNDRVQSTHIVPIVCRVRSVGIEEAPKPVKIEILEVSPNPFNSACKIKFSTPGGDYDISVFDILGRKVSVIGRGELPSGSYSAVFAARDSEGMELPSGVYFIRLSGVSGESIKKISITK